LPALVFFAGVLVGMDFLRVCAVAHIAPRYLHRVWPARTRTIRSVTRVLPAQPSTRTGGSLKPGAARRRRPRDQRSGYISAVVTKQPQRTTKVPTLPGPLRTWGATKTSEEGPRVRNPSPSSGESFANLKVTIVRGNSYFVTSDVYSGKTQARERSAKTEGSPRKPRVILDKIAGGYTIPVAGGWDVDHRSAGTRSPQYMPIARRRTPPTNSRRSRPDGPR